MHVQKILVTPARTLNVRTPACSGTPVVMRKEHIGTGLECHRGSKNEAENILLSMQMQDRFMQPIKAHLTIAFDIRKVFEEGNDD